MSQEDLNYLVLNFSIWNKADSESDILVGEVSIPLSSLNLDEGRVFHPYTLHRGK